MDIKHIALVKNITLSLVSFLKADVLKYDKEVYVVGEGISDGKCWEYAITLSVADLLDQEDYGLNLTVSLNCENTLGKLEIAIIRSYGKLIVDKILVIHDNIHLDELKAAFNEMRSVLLRTLEDLYM